MAQQYLNVNVGAQAAQYSLMKEVDTYTGYAVKVRRSSDNTTQDIGFNVNGGFDSASFLSFIGAGSGFIDTFYDQTESGYDIVQATTASQPEIVSVDGYYMLKCTGGDFIENASFIGALTNATVSIIWKAPITRPSGFLTYQSGGMIDSTNNKYIVPYFTTNQGPMFYQTDSTFLYQHGNTILHTFTFTNGTCRIYEYGAQSRIVSTTPNPDFGKLTLGKTNFSSGDLYIASFALWDSIVDVADINSTYQNNYSTLVPTSSDILFMSIGDSISTTTFSGGPGTNWPYIAHTNAGSTWHFGAVQSGSTLEDWNTDVDKITWYAQNLQNRKMVAIVFLGGNDILGGATGAQAFTRLETLVTNLKAGGYFHVFVITCLPRYATGTQNNTDFETHRQTFNDAIRANANGLFDQIIDVETIAIGENGNQDATTNYLVDHIHLNSTGSQLLGELVDDYITNSLQGDSVSITVNEDLGGRDILGATESAVASTVTVLDYSADTDFTYDNTKIEFASGKASLKNQFASDVVCASTFATTKNLEYSRDGGNTTKIAEAGTITNSGGKLVFTSGANARLVWEGINNLPKSGVGCIRFRWTPNYTGAPASLQYLFQWHEILGATRSYMYFIDNGATMYTQINNGAAATKHSGSYAYSPTSGVEVEVELNFDFGNNSYNLYFDATRRSTAASSAYTVDYTDKLVGRLFLGDNDSDAGTVVLNGSIRDLMIFDAVQNSGGTRTTGYVVPTSKYSTADDVITLTTGVSASALSGFEAVTYASGSDSVKFHILVGAQARYWNGSAWANSNASLAQSNSATEIATNASSLEAGTYKVVAVLHSATGATTPSISSVTFVTT